MNGGKLVLPFLRKQPFWEGPTFPFFERTVNQQPIIASALFRNKSYRLTTKGLEGELRWVPGPGF